MATSLSATAAPISTCVARSRHPVAASAFVPAGLSRKTTAPRRLQVQASGNAREGVPAVSGLVTAAALAAALAVPGIAEAAQPGMSPSLQNFLLSIASGGAVLVAIFGAVVGVANFDPVKRT